MLLVLHQCVYGLRHRRVPGHRQKLCADGDRDIGLVRVSGGVGVYDLCAIAHDSVAVSAVSDLVDDHGGGRDCVFCSLLPQTAAVRAVRE